MHACRQRRKSLNENHVLMASKRHENFSCAQLLSLPNAWKKSPWPSPGALRGTLSHRVYFTRLPPTQLVRFDPRNPMTSLFSTLILDHLPL